MIDISKLTPAELSRLAKSIEKEIAKRTDTTKSKVLKAVAKLAKEAGLEVGDLLGRKRAPKRGWKVAPDGADITPAKKGQKTGQISKSSRPETALERPRSASCLGGGASSQRWSVGRLAHPAQGGCRGRLSAARSLGAPSFAL